MRHFKFLHSSHSLQKAGAPESAPALIPSSSSSPFPAYSGSEPYIFISYSHRDRHLVFPEIERLYRAGYRVWYDEGINPGSNWRKELVRAIEGCSVLVVFLSKTAVESQHVTTEVILARENQKPVQPVYMERVTLNDDLKYEIGRIQGILRYNETPERFYSLLTKSLSLVTRGPVPSSTPPGPVPLQAPIQAPNLPQPMAPISAPVSTQTRVTPEDFRNDLLTRPTDSILKAFFLSSNEAWIEGAKKILQSFYKKKYAVWVTALNSINTRLPKPPVVDPLTTRIYLEQMPKDDLLFWIACSNNHHFWICRRVAQRYPSLQGLDLVGKTATERDLEREEEEEAIRAYEAECRKKYAPKSVEDEQHRQTRVMKITPTLY